MKNKEVVQKFIAGQNGHAASLQSVNGVLLSYGWYELARWVDGQIIVRKGGMYSRTTLRHRSLVLREIRKAGNELSFKIADVETPGGQARMDIAAEEINDELSSSSSSSHGQAEIESDLAIDETQAA